MTVLAHAGEAVAPHDLWGAWSLHPLTLLALFAAGWDFRRARCFAAALAVTAVALLSPLAALSGVLASAHMVQHVLLVLVAAPLLALSSPFGTVVRGTPLAIRRLIGPWQRRQRLLRKRLGGLGGPVAITLLHIGVLWFWHASGPYEAALASEPLHVVEHASFVVTAFLFWRVTIGPQRHRRVSEGFGILLVFGMALQSVFLSALLTFASSPWYSPYATTTAEWGLDALGDQQLAGVIMWVPAGLVYLAAALTLLLVWVRSTDGDAPNAHGELVALEEG
jgi:putative membrane protein